MDSKSLRSAASLSPFKQDIDDLITGFAQTDSTNFADWKKAWASRKFGFIFEAMPSARLPLFMQSLYAHSIGYMVGVNASLSQRLGGLYCLYCLYETQPFKPPFKIYLSLGELKKLTNLVVAAKENHAVRLIVCKMLEKNMFLFGAVDLNEGSSTELVDQLTQLQNNRVRHAYKKLFPDTRLDWFLHMDLASEFDLNALKKMSTEYSDAKKRAIKEASNVVDVGDIKHISDGKDLIGDVVENIRGSWDVQKEMFYKQTGLDQHAAKEQEQDQQLQRLEEENEDDNENENENDADDDDEFGCQLEMQLYEEDSQGQDQEDDFD